MTELNDKVENPENTLERLAERHDVDAAFRNKFVRNKLIGWPIGILTGAAITSGAVYWMAADEVGFFNCLTTAIGAATTGGSIYQLVKAIKTRGEYRNEDENLCPKAYYHLDIGISSLETAVERNYGTPIITRDSVEELKDFKINEFMFIDHVFVSRPYSHIYDVIETDPECGSSSINCYRGSFTLKRDDTKQRFGYDVRSDKPTDMKNLMGNTNRELALLLTSPSNTTHNTKPFDVVAMYDQKTLERI